MLLLCWCPLFSFGRRPCSVHLPVIHCEQLLRTDDTENSHRRSPPADAKNKQSKIIA